MIEIKDEILENAINGAELSEASKMMISKTIINKKFRNAITIFIFAGTLLIFDLIFVQNKNVLKGTDYVLILVTVMLLIGAMLIFHAHKVKEDIINGQFTYSEAISEGTSLFKGVSGGYKKQVKVGDYRYAIYGKLSDFKKGKSIYLINIKSEPQIIAIATIFQPKTSDESTN